MKKFLSLLLLISCINLYIGLPAFAVKSAVVNQVDVKSGIRIPIVVTSENTSKNIVAGQKINGVIEDDIKINNVVVFKKGDNAVLNVSDVKKAGFIGNAGEILLVNGEVIDANGERHLVEYNRKITGEEKTYPKVLLATSIFFLFPLALFGFVKGGQAKINPHSPIDVSLRNDFNFVPEKL